MKKILAAALASLMLLSSCGVTDSELPSLEIRGLEIAAMLDEAAANEEFVQLYSAGEEIINAVQLISEGDHSSPNAVYQLNISEESSEAFAIAQAIPGLSDDLRDFLTNRMYTSVISLANARGGVDTLAASSICTVSKTFVSDEITESTLYLYTYENASPVIVAFLVGEGNTVSASGSFLYAESLNTDSPEGIREFFLEFSFDVEAVPLR